LISNLYTWIFPAAVFAAAGIFNLGSSVRRKRDPKRARSNKLIWFSINISIAFCFIAASAFFVNWSEFVWSVKYLYFSLIVFILFYLSFIFRYVIGLPLVFILALIVLFFNTYLQEWRPVNPDRVLGSYRILSNNGEGVAAELSVFNSVSPFIKEDSSDIVLIFEIMEIDRSLFFIDSMRYYRLKNSMTKLNWKEKIINYIVERTFLLSKEDYSVKLSDKVLFFQYSMVLDIYQKKIIIEN